MIAGASALLIVALAFHPVAHAPSIEAALPEVVSMRVVDGVVHGTIMLLYAILFIGFVQFAKRLGPERLTVRCGLICFATAGLMILGAALLDGFVTPDLAAHYVNAPAAKQELAGGLLTLISLMIQALTKLGLVCQALSTIAWSLALFKLGRTGSGAIGLGAGILPLVVIGGVNPALGPHLLIIALALQAVWNLFAATLLFVPEKTKGVAVAG